MKKCFITSGPQGGTLIFSYFHRLGSFFGGQNFVFKYFWGFSEKEYLWGMKILWISFWGHHKIGLYLGGHFYAFRVFS